MTGVAKDKADRSLDTFNERVVRNEGRLDGHIEKVASDRESDRKITDQRAQSLADELERRAENLVTLSDSQRDADLNEMRTKFSEIEHARVIQFTEYKRRLKGLNGEAKRIRDVQAQSVTREAFDAEVLRGDELRAAMSSRFDERHAEVKSYVDQQIGKGLGRGELIALVVSVTIVLGFIIAFANYASTR